jgi:hypothetical protein
VYATIRSYTGTGLADALASREGEIREVIATINGFRAYYLVRTTDGNTVAISVFENESGAEESTRAAAEWVAENMPELASGPPQVTTGEVVFGL